MTKHISLYVYELADYYCMSTLYNYYKGIMPSSLDMKFSMDAVRDGSDNGTVRSLIKQNGYECRSRNAGLTISGYSDVSNVFPKPDWLDIDQLIFKNSVIPMSSEEKQALKTRYGFGGDLPSTVLWMGRRVSEFNLDNAVSLIQKLKEYSDIYVFDSQPRIRHILDKDSPHNERIHIVEGYGSLRDYFAMADIALYADNLSCVDGAMHNFVEATEGGPLFIVPPTFGQFGLKSLTERGVIFQYDNYAALEKGVLEYAQCFVPVIKDAHTLNRADHLNEARSRYMPVIVSAIEAMMIPGKRILGSDLIFYESDSHPSSRRIMHPETQWSFYKIYSNYNYDQNGKDISVKPADNV